ncbi:hypothetical protein EWH21_13195 [Pseudomonas sp. REST10]|uniref:hypothetical protein n=1 Tax=Pseudomonas sp. REST10 TaxID=2512235 RepID=UPI00240D13E1|nr:hypothetical protein [Pseudomonas sp. REST10]WFC62632.1 hypothetical protein EWH21_13195 [Pseudomonas sp. REST10]
MSYLDNIPRNSRTSLTKHGAHKVASLIERFGASWVLANLHGSVQGINIDYSQAAKNLGAYDGSVPAFWDVALSVGRPAVNALVLMAITLSHSELVGLMRNSRKLGSGRGIVYKEGCDTKSFTNFKNNFIELGFSERSSVDSFTYNLSKIFRPEIAPMARDLIQLKLEAAGAPFARLERMIQDENIHNILGVDRQFFESWLFSLPTSKVEVPEDVAEDLSFLLDDSDRQNRSLIFTPGHTPKKTGVVSVNVAHLTFTMKLEHNELQTKLHRLLADEYGEDNVVTEHDYVDALVVNGSEHILYEIKTAPTAKLCIRQAISQLLEYAYWPGSAFTVAKLIIVASADPTLESESFLRLLRERFNLPVYYQQLKL